MLEIAKTQLNELSNLYVEDETRSSPGSRRVTHIRFVFRQQEGKGRQSSHESKAGKELDNTLRGEFGLGTRESEDIGRRPHGFAQDRVGGGWTIPTAGLAEDPLPAPTTAAHD